MSTDGKSHGLLVGLALVLIVRKTSTGRIVYNKVLPIDTTHLPIWVPARRRTLMDRQLNVQVCGTVVLSAGTSSQRQTTRGKLLS